MLDSALLTTSAGPVLVLAAANSVLPHSIGSFPLSNQKAALQRPFAFRALAVPPSRDRLPSNALISLSQRRSEWIRLCAGNPIQPAAAFPAHPLTNRILYEKPSRFAEC